MGHGIAQVFAVAGHNVAVHDPFAEALASLHARIAKNLADLGQDEHAVEPCPRVDESGRRRRRCRRGHRGSAGKAAAETGDLRRARPPGAAPGAPRQQHLVIPIGRIARACAHRDRVLGTHWWVPPYLVPLVEVIQTEGTAPEAIAAMMELLTSVGKAAVHVRKDVPGFIGNRLQHALWREAIALVQAGVCDAPTIDKVVKASFGRRLAVIGPLESADLVGTDLALDCHVELLADLDRTPGPLPYLENLVASGRLGFKSGEGFRKWTPAEQAELRAKLTAHLKKMAAELDRP